MKKIAAISFLLLLLFGTAGYYFVFTIKQQIQKEAVKKQIAAALPLSQLNKIELEKNASLIRWEEEGKEFYLGDHLYDVVTLRQAEGKTLVYYISDEKEEQLLKEQSAAVCSSFNADHSGKNPAPHFSFQLPDFLSGPPVSYPSFLFRTQYFFAYKISLQSVGITIITPPPEFNV